MTQEEKDFLIRDLCARLPYGVKCISGADDATLIIEGINPSCCGASEIQVTYERSGINFDTTISAIKPYLFPLSSITEEQINELSKLDVSYGDYALHDSVFGLGISVDEAYIFFEFCYKHHIDFLGLIDLGLAIDATGLNIY